MYKYFTTSILIILCTYSNVFSQNKINGRLINDKQQAISYASISIENTGKGTISNIDGKFELYILDENKNAKLIISCIGYKSAIFSVDSIFTLQKNKQAILLQLSKESYRLHEVIVRKQEILKDPKLIFSKALQMIPKHLDSLPNVGKYYFRQTHRNDSTMNRLIEAAVSVYDEGVNTNIDHCKFNVDQLKSSYDNRVSPHEINLDAYRQWAERGKGKFDMKVDNRIPKAKGTIYTTDTIWKDPNIQNYLTNMFDKTFASLDGFYKKTNMLRTSTNRRRKRSKLINPGFSKGGPILTKSFVKEHTLKLDTILMYNNEIVYKIKILPNKKYPGLEGQRARYIPIGWAYIRLKDFAFLGLDYAYITNPNNKGYKYKGNYHGGFNGKYQYKFQYKIRYKEFNNKLYPSYLYYYRSDYNNAEYANMFITPNSVYLNIPTTIGRQVCIQELVNTEIITKKETVQNILESKKWENNQFEAIPFNKKFWDNYSVMLPSIHEQTMTKQLEKELLKKRKKR